MTAASRLGCSLLALALAAGGAAARAEDGNPFVPPSQREADREAQMQRRVDKAVGELEGRLMQSLVNSLEGKGPASAAQGPLAEALKKLNRSNAPPASPFAGPGGQPVADRASGLPALPPLPGTAATRDSPVPPGSLFIGCLDHKAFFQDQAGSPFQVDPAAFPSGPGPGGCGRWLSIGSPRH